MDISDRFELNRLRDAGGLLSTRRVETQRARQELGEAQRNGFITDDAEFARFTAYYDDVTASINHEQSRLLEGIKAIFMLAKQKTALITAGI